MSIQGTGPGVATGAIGPTAGGEALGTGIGAAADTGAECPAGTGRMAGDGGRTADTIPGAAAATAGGAPPAMTPTEAGGGPALASTVAMSPLAAATAGLALALPLLSQVIWNPKGVAMAYKLASSSTSGIRRVVSAAKASSPTAAMILLCWPSIFALNSYHRTTPRLNKKGIE